MISMRSPNRRCSLCEVTLTCVVRISVRALYGCNMGGSSSKAEEQRKQTEEILPTQNAYRASVRQSMEEELERKRREERLEAVRRQQQQQQQQRIREEQQQQRMQQRLQRLREEQQRSLNRLSQHKVTKNLQLLNDLRRAFGLQLLESYPSKPYEETCLDTSSAEYHDVYFGFKQGNKPFFTISNINKVNNTFHDLQYRLMFTKYENVYGDYGLDFLMYHGTKLSNLNGICTYNFDRSKVHTHKFGYGTSFARDSYYATHYHHDNKKNNYKVMVVAKVYYGDVEQGNQFTTIPDDCYTSTNDKESVIVKYDDASAYPAYVIHYTGLHPYQPKRRNNPFI